jgi:hypothetical protein
MDAKYANYPLHVIVVTEQKLGHKLCDQKKRKSSARFQTQIGFLLRNDGRSVVFPLGFRITEESKKPQAFTHRGSPGSKIDCLRMYPRPGPPS